MAGTRSGLSSGSSGPWSVGHGFEGRTSAVSFIFSVTLVEAASLDLNSFQTLDKVSAGAQLNNTTRHVST